MTYPVPADEFPLHQSARSLRYAATTDRNFYDRYYFNAHDRTGKVFLITGLGLYPHLGVVDAFAAVRSGGRIHSLRCSDALADDFDRLNPRVGPYRIEVPEPLRRLRVVCDGAERGLAFDLAWEGSFPAIEEEPHVIRHGARTILDAQRFAQVGTWSGWLRIGDEELRVDSERWVGTRDRSWGTRPIGEPDASGRAIAEGTGGFYWLYVPLRFDDHGVIVIVQESPDGQRTLNDAKRVWRDGRIDQLGWPRVAVRYRSGTRHPEGATIHLTERDGTPFAIEIETLGAFPLHVGCGYGPDPDWQHGQWKGRGWVEGAVYDLADRAVAARIPFGNIDHVARATCRDAEGWGLFEHACVGRHDPSGFRDFTSVAT